MAIIERPAPTVPAIVTPTTTYGVLKRPVSATGWRSWVFTVDHKKLGIMYGATAMFFFIVGGVEALLIRLQLAAPNGKVLNADLYNQMFTMHATTMVFLFVMPMAAGFANYFVPLQIGARDVAFPRLNAFGFWAFLFGGIFLNLAWFLGGAADGGALPDHQGLRARRAADQGHGAGRHGRPSARRRHVRLPLVGSPPTASRCTVASDSPGSTRRTCISSARLPTRHYWAVPNNTAGELQHWCSTPRSSTNRHGWRPESPDVKPSHRCCGAS